MEAKAELKWSPEAHLTIEARVRLALQSGRVSLGASTEIVETLWPGEGGSRHSVTTTNGTTALELIWRTLSPEVVIVPEMTVPMVKWSTDASLKKVRLEVVDVDDYMCASIPEIDKMLDVYASSGVDMSKVAVCYVLTAGLVNPEIVSAVGRWRRLRAKVVFDMSHAHGATLNGYGLYNIADAAAWSFYATKVLTCGEGGIAWFDDPNAFANAKLIANQGKERGSPKFSRQGKPYRLSEFAAAVMSYEVEMARHIYECRRAVANVYDSFGMQGMHSRVPGLDTTFYKYVLPVSETKYGQDSADDVEAAFKSLGVFCTGRVHGFTENRGAPWDRSKSRFWARNHVCLPVGRNMHPAMLETVEKAWNRLRKA